MHLLVGQHSCARQDNKVLQCQRVNSEPTICSSSRGCCYPPSGSTGFHCTAFSSDLDVDVLITVHLLHQDSTFMSNLEKWWTHVHIIYKRTVLEFRWRSLTVILNLHPLQVSRTMMEIFLLGRNRNWSADIRRLLQCSTIYYFCITFSSVHRFTDVSGFSSSLQNLMYLHTGLLSDVLRASFPEG